MNTTYQCGIIVATVPMTFFHFNQADQKTFYIEIAQDVTWLATTESYVEYCHGGQSLKEGSTHTDYNGYMTSFNDCGFEHGLKTYGITIDSSLELKVNTRLFLKPFFQNKETLEHNSKADKEGWRYKFVYNNDKYRIAHHEADYDNGKSWIVRLSDIQLLSEIITTSKKTDSENAEMISLFKHKYGPSDNGSNAFLTAELNKLLAQHNAETEKFRRENLIMKL